MELRIPNAALVADDVPRDASDSDALDAFARSFDGYAHWGDRCGQKAAAVARAFHQTGLLPTRLSDLRACLFYENEAWRWNPGPLDDHARRFLQALLDAIRTTILDRSNDDARPVGHAPRDADADLFQP